MISNHIGELNSLTQLNTRKDGVKNKWQNFFYAMGTGNARKVDYTDRYRALGKSTKEDHYIMDTTASTDNIL